MISTLTAAGSALDRDASLPKKTLSYTARGEVRLSDRAANNVPHLRRHDPNEDNKDSVYISSETHRRRPRRSSRPCIAIASASRGRQDTSDMVLLPHQ